MSALRQSELSDNCCPPGKEIFASRVYHLCNLRNLWTDLCIESWILQRLPNPSTDYADHADDEKEPNTEPAAIRTNKFVTT